MNAYLEIIRPGNAIMAVIAVLLIAIISGIFTFKVLLGCIVVFIVTGAGNSINDYLDYKIDDKMFKIFLRYQTKKKEKVDI